MASSPAPRVTPHTLACTTPLLQLASNIHTEAQGTRGPHLTQITPYMLVCIPTLLQLASNVRTEAQGKRSPHLQPGHAPHAGVHPQQL
eukprot:scaffold50976_cov20-Tisochrysis_lutea.AAC.1